MKYHADDRDNANLTGVPEHLHGLRILQHKARWRLAEALLGKDVHTAPDDLYINSVNDPDEGLVVHHVSLVDAVVDAVQNAEPPVYAQSHSGIFSVRASFEKAHRADGGDLGFEGFMRIVGEVYEQLA